MSPQNAKVRNKRRAPSGAAKVKLAGDKKMKQNIEMRSARNEILADTPQHNSRVTPVKALPNNTIDGSLSNQLSMHIRHEENSEQADLMGNQQTFDDGFEQTFNKESNRD